MDNFRSWFARSGILIGMASGDVAAAIDGLLAAQDGVIGRRQARAAGMSNPAIERLVRSGRWLRELPGVLRSAQVPYGPMARVRAAAMWVGPSGRIAAAAAAWWWELTDIEPVTTEVIVPHSSTRRAPPGICVVRRDLDPRDGAVHRGVAVTGLALSALHGAVALGSPAGPMMLDRALQRRCGFDEVLGAYHRQIGCHRSAEARVLMAAAGDRAAAESERRFIRLLKGAGIHGWSVNALLMVRGADYRPDVCFRAERLIVELDGWAWHHSPDRFRHDRRRQNDLILAGWTILRFTWFDLVERPAWVVAQVRQALALRRAG